MHLGPTPIRLNPEGNGEMIWCVRIDPARAIIRNVPLPDSGYRYGDVLLHDGAPNGTRVWRGQEVPVFDALQLLQASPYATYMVRVQAASTDDVLGLATLAEERDCGIEDWETIRQLCAACSAGNPGPHDTPAPYAEGQLVELAIAATSDGALRDLLAAWNTAYPASLALDVTLLLPGAVSAV
jgi:hypothetical protein